MRHPLQNNAIRGSSGIPKAFAEKKNYQDIYNDSQITGKIQQKPLHAMADQNPKKRKELEKKIREFTREVYQEQVWLIEKIAEEIPAEGLLFIDLADGSADNLTLYYGVFVTPNKEIYGFSGEQGIDYDTDEEIDEFFIEKYETPESLPVEVEENPLLEIALQMDPI